MKRPQCHWNATLLLIVLVCLGVSCQAQAEIALTPEQTEYLERLKEQVNLPPETVSFFDQKEKQARQIASHDHFEFTAAMKEYFDAARAGRLRQARRIAYPTFGDTNAPCYKSSLKQLTVDTTLVIEAFGEGDPEMVLALGRDLMAYLPAGCMYFGGDDPGRGLPTMLCKAPGEPVFVLTQNALTDGRYMEYVRDMYGARIQLPTTNEVQHSIDAFPKAQQSQNVMKINGLIAKTIFDKNPGREFYYEQSYPLDWAYPYLSPHGPIMKLNRQALPAISGADLKADTAYWSAKVEQLKGNPKFKGNDYTGKAWSHLRSCIAGLYAWRAQTAKEAGEREKMCQAAEAAFNQALRLNASTSEAVWGYVNLEASQGKLDAALSVAKKALSVEPSNGQLKDLVSQLEKADADARTKPPK